MTRSTDIECPYCGKKFKSNFIRKHLINEHGLTDVEWMVLSEKHSTSSRKRFPNIPIDVVSKYLELVYAKSGKLERYKIWNTQFCTFYRIVSHCRDFVDTDYNQFFSVVLPWQEQHPKTCNSKELCKLCHPTNEEFANKAYHELMEVKNPYYNHGGKFSPFSSKFVGYEGLSDEERRDAAKQRARENNDNIVHTNSIQYWLNKGYDESTARKMLSDRQRTFTLEKCIEKYGESDGIKVYNDRQQRWLSTLKSKSSEEIDRINVAKSPKKPKSSGFSYESQALFWELESKRGYKSYSASFALNGDEKNNEFIFNRGNGRRFFLDYCIPELKCVIEYNGTAWHDGHEEYDLNRNNEIIESGYHVLVITDVEYKEHRLDTIRKCIEFINKCGEEHEQIC